MREFLVKLRSVEDVRSFVDVASSYPFPVEAVVRDCVVDAKSLIGLFSIDLQKPVTIRMNATEEEAASFRKKLGALCVEA